MSSEITAVLWKGMLWNVFFIGFVVAFVPYSLSRKDIILLNHLKSNCVKTKSAQVELL